MKPENFKIHELIEQLQGTCKTLDEMLPDGMEYDDLTTEDHEAIDSDIFKCTCCGWWCEMSENHEDESGELVCDDCYEGGDDD